MQDSFTLAVYDACGVETLPPTMATNAVARKERETIITDVQPYRFPGPNSKPARTRSLTQLIDASEVLYQRIMTTALDPVELSSLARALCDVDKRIRAWKGLPEPGQLRPDCLPGKRAKKGKFIELVEEPREAPEQPKPAADTDARQSTAQTPAEEKSKIELDTQPANPPQ